MKNKVSPQQLGFKIEGGRLITPPSLHDKPFGQKITSVLEGSLLFKEKPKQGYVLLIDLTGETPSSTIYNPDNWQAQNQKPEHFINPNYSALVVVTSQVVSPEELSQLIGENKKSLNPDGGEIFIFETNLSLNPDEFPLIREKREKVLKDLGFIKGKVAPLARPKKDIPVSEILTQARLKKIAEHHPHEVDLLTPRPDDPPWKQKWRKNIIPQIVAIYQQAGFIEVDTREIEERLKHSTNPPADLAKARDGLGVIAKALCGCQIHVSLNGAITVLNHCQEHPDGIPNKEKFPALEKPKYKVGERELNRFCGDCGSNLIQSTRIIKSYPNGRVSLQVEISCPHCGLLSTKRVYVPKTSVEF